MHTPAFIATITPVVLNSDAYDSGDVLFDTTEVGCAAHFEGGVAGLNSITLLDKDDQKIAMTLVFFDANVSLGTKDSAPSISDTNAENVVGYLDIAAGDYKDLGGASVAVIRNVGLVMKAGAATRSLWVAAFTGGTPTHTTGGLILKLAFVQA